MEQTKFFTAINFVYCVIRNQLPQLRHGHLNRSVIHIDLLSVWLAWAKVIALFVPIHPTFANSIQLRAAQFTTNTTSSMNFFGFLLDNWVTYEQPSVPNLINPLINFMLNLRIWVRLIFACDGRVAHKILFNFQRWVQHTMNCTSADLASKLQLSHCPIFNDFKLLSSSGTALSFALKENRVFLHLTRSNSFMIIVAGLDSAFVFWYVSFARVTSFVHAGGSEVRSTVQIFLFPYHSTVLFPES